MEAGVEASAPPSPEASIEVEIAPGGEIALDALPTLSREDLARFTLGANGRYLLLEFLYGGWPLDLEQRIRAGRQRLTPILAHPERSRDVQDDPRRLARAVPGGALVQVTAAAIDGRLGRSPKAAAARLLELGLVHTVASDAHTPDIRAVGLSNARKAISDDGLARYWPKMRRRDPGRRRAGPALRPAPPLQSLQRVWRAAGRAAGRRGRRDRRRPRPPAS